jgi:ribosomal protein S18 acetylase RimI-like enzyme
MLFRSIVAEDLDRLTAVRVAEPVSWIPADRYRAELADRMYRPEWSWIAETDHRIVARALWWGRSAIALPIALDCLYVEESIDDKAGLAAQLLAAGHQWFREQGAELPPMFNITLANDWHDDPAARNAIAWRQAAAGAVGLTNHVERLQFEWTPQVAVPEPTGRLVFRPEPDDAAILALFRRIAEGSLDDETGRNLARVGPDETARLDLEFYLDAPGKRDWWRTAHTPDGVLVGLAIPSATAYHRNVGYLGVLPEARGRGFGSEIVAEITRMHAADGAEKITATTDVVNFPMAAGFRRLGYRNTETRVIFSAD